MKTNNTKKIIVSTLSIAMGAALVGSISGSVAWYQYSTRASASLVGTAVGTSRNLEVSTDGTNFNNYVEDGLATHDLQPVRAVKASDGSGDLTSLTLAEMAFYDKPVYQYPKAPATALASTDGFLLQETYYFRINDFDGTDHDYSAEQNIYLQELQVLNTSAAGKLDISNAVKVHIEAGSVKGTFGNEASLKQYGQLDLSVGTNGAGILDTDGIRLNDLEGAPIIYGTSLTKITNPTGEESIAFTLNAPNDTIPADKLTALAKDQYIKVNGYYKWDGTKFISNGAAGATTVAHLPTDTSGLSNGDTFTVTGAAGLYKVDATPVSQTVSAITTKSGLFCNDTDPYHITGTALTATTGYEDATEAAAASAELASVTITIWLEGWGLVNGSASWDLDDYVDSSVEIVARFTTEAK